MAREVELEISSPNRAAYQAGWEAGYAARLKEETDAYVRTMTSGREIYDRVIRDLINLKPFHERESDRLAIIKEAHDAGVHNPIISDAGVVGERGRRGCPWCTETRTCPDGHRMCAVNHAASDPHHNGSYGAPKTDTHVEPSHQDRAWSDHHCTGIPRDDGIARCGRTDLHDEHVWHQGDSDTSTVMPDAPHRKAGVGIEDRAIGCVYPGSDGWCIGAHAECEPRCKYRPVAQNPACTCSVERGGLVGTSDIEDCPKHGPMGVQTVFDAQNPDYGVACSELPGCRPGRDGEHSASCEVALAAAAGHALVQGMGGLCSCGDPACTEAVKEPAEQHPCADGCKDPAAHAEGAHDV